MASENVLIDSPIATRPGVCNRLSTYVILLSTLTSVASGLFNYSLQLDNELLAMEAYWCHGVQKIGIS